MCERERKRKRKVEAKKGVLIKAFFFLFSFRFTNFYMWSKAVHWIWGTLFPVLFYYHITDINIIMEHSIKESYIWSALLFYVDSVFQRFPWPLLINNIVLSSGLIEFILSVKTIRGNTIIHMHTCATITITYDHANNKNSHKYYHGLIDLVIHFYFIV